MITLDLTVNGDAVSTRADPRTSLADLLRDRFDLTGTHLGCEQGVCGACTILVDGVPVRSCISTAATCNGADIRTIEDFDDDPLMIRLREAFKACHGLQCGFCTPGMLIMSRDIVQRLGDADEERIRLELSGNLCRCTGYLGIVRAVRSVIEDGTDVAPPEDARRDYLGPAGGGHDGPTPEAAASRRVELQGGRTPAARSLPQLPKGKRREPSVRESFVIDAPPEAVWERFSDVPAMIACIPGANLLGQEEDGSYRVAMRIRMGPIGAEFSGVADQERNDADMVGTIRGAGRDARSAALAEGEMTYRLSPEEGGASTRVAIEIGYQLSGALAQFARAGIVNHFVGSIAAQFAENLGRSLRGEPQGAPEGRNELRIAGSLWTAMRAWLSSFLRRSGGK